MTEDSVMAAASFTKVALTYLVLQLVDERKLDLDKLPLNSMPPAFRQRS